MEPLKKQIQNRRYYEAHPEIKIKARERQRKLRSHRLEQRAFTNPENENGILLSCDDSRRYEKPPIMPRKRILRGHREQNDIIAWISSLFSYPTLLLWGTFILLLSLFLFREMYLFYSEGGQNHFWSLLQAGLGEAVLLLFSGFQGKSWFEKIQYRGLVFALCGFSIYTMSARQVGSGLQAIRHDQLSQEIIASLKLAVTDKMAERNRYLDQALIWPARKAQRELEALRKELSHRMDHLALKKPQAVATQNLFSQVIFRVLFLFANLLAVRRFAQLRLECLGQQFIPIPSFQNPILFNKKQIHLKNKMPCKDIQSLKGLSAEWIKKFRLKLAQWISGQEWVPG